MIYYGGIPILSHITGVLKCLRNPVPVPCGTFRIVTESVRIESIRNLILRYACEVEGKYPFYPFGLLWVEDQVAILDLIAI